MGLAQWLPAHFGPAVAARHPAAPEAGAGGGRPEVLVAAHVALDGLASLEHRCRARQAQAVQARRALVARGSAHPAEGTAPVLRPRGRAMTELFEAGPRPRRPPVPFAPPAQAAAAVGHLVAIGHLAHGEPEHRVLGGRGEQLRLGVPAEAAEEPPVDQPSERLARAQRLGAAGQGGPHCPGWAHSLPSFRRCARRCRVSLSTASTASRARRWLGCT